MFENCKVDRAFIETGLLVIRYGTIDEVRQAIDELIDSYEYRISKETRDRLIYVMRQRIDREKKDRIDIAVCPNQL